MKNLKILSVFCLAFLTPGLLAQPVMAVTGDVNGDEIAYATDDLVYLLCYLFENGPPPPNPIDAEVDHMAVHPVPGDASTPLGAIFTILSETQGWPVRCPLPDLGLGRQPDETEIAAAIKAKNGTVVAEYPDDVVDYATERIARGQIAGWLHGRDDFGSCSFFFT